MNTNKTLLALPVAALALALTACGGTSYGDVEGQVLALPSASEQPVLVNDASVVLAGNGLDCGKRSDRCVARTDGSGKYTFKEVPAGPYAIAFNAPESRGKFQDETRQFTVSSNAVETVSVVLLAEGMTRPEVPDELANRPAGQQGGYSSGLTSNPFFWYWMFNQPWIGGYGRPPVVVVNPDRTVTVDRTQPTTSTAGRPYSSYGPGAKPAPAKVESKGVSRPGQGALGSGSGLDTSVRSGSGSAGSVRAPSNTTPPRVGAGGGSTARRAPPPRVRVGRR